MMHGRADHMRAARAPGADDLVIEGLTSQVAARGGIHDLSVVIGAGRFTGVLGSSGAGKTALTRALMGLNQPSSGRVMLGRTDLLSIPTGRRAIGYIPQTFALFPHMSIYNNIAYPLRLQGVKKDDLRDKVHWAAEFLSITPLLSKKPQHLSGGEKQRVAIARGVVSDVGIFIFEDPLVGLDFKLRERLSEELREMQRSLKAMFIYATADPIEIMAMADDLVVLDQGKLVESGSVGTVYDAPGHRRAMAIVGYPPANFLRGALKRDGGQWECEFAGGGFVVRSAEDQGGVALAEGGVDVGIRPECIVQDEANGTNAGDVKLVEDLGSERIIHFAFADSMLVTVESADRPELDIGDKLVFRLDIGGLRCFDSNTGRLRAVGEIGS